MRRRKKMTKNAQHLEIPVNLRRFRKKLGLSQKAFGTAFSGYTRRQINAYESGESEIPIGLLLVIRNKGYPLDVVIGQTDRAEVIAEVIGYIPHLLKVLIGLRRLTEEVLRTIDQQEKKLTDILDRIGIR